jgi:hypothetical protein
MILLSYHKKNMKQVNSIRYYSIESAFYNTNTSFLRRVKGPLVELVKWSQ